jgi:flagellar protein FlgJ
MPLNPSQVAFLGLAATAAVQSQKATGVPAALTLAQAIFESGWGAHMPGNNCFGLKANGRGCGTCTVPTMEYVGGKWVEEPLAFEAYSTLGDCFTDHAWLIANGAPYRAAWAAYHSPSGLYSIFVLSVGKIYATDPTYGQTILAFSLGSTVQDALRDAGLNPVKG